MEKLADLLCETSKFLYCKKPIGILDLDRSFNLYKLLLIPLLN